MAQCDRRCTEKCIAFPCNTDPDGRCVLPCKYEKEPPHIPHACEHRHQWTVIELNR